MIYQDSYQTVRFGRRFKVQGTEIVNRDGFFVLRQGRSPNGGATSADPHEEILPEGTRAEVVVLVEHCGVIGVQFVAFVDLFGADGVKIRRINESSNIKHGTQEQAIRSLIPEGFPFGLRLCMPSSSTLYGETWEQAVALAEENSPGWAELDWWQACKEAVLPQAVVG